LFYENGKKISYSLKTRDRIIAKFKKNEIENKLSVGDSPSVRTTIRISEALSQFKQSREGRITGKSSDYFRIEKFLKDEQITSLRGITEETIKRHCDERIQKKEISPTTANHTIRAIKTFLNFCLKRKHLSENPLTGTAKYPIQDKEPRFLSREEVAVVLKAASSQPIYLILFMAIYTGMRLGELERLEWKDIDFEDNVMTVHISKSKKFRKIPIHADLRRILLPLKDQGSVLKIKSIDSFEWQFSQFRKTLKIPYFRFHDLRHTFASLLIKSGVDILTVSKLLGHSSVIVTQMYSHLYKDHLDEAIKKLQI
jgi:integrase